MRNILHWKRGAFPSFIQDIRYALRLMAKNPGLTAVMAATIAIGVGGSAALFSVVDCLLLRPFPYPQPERLQVIWSRPAKGGITNVSPANLIDYREQNRAFQAIGGVMQAEFNVSIHGVADRLTGFQATAGFLEALGIGPKIGRAFGAADERPGAPRVAILSHGAWQGRFGGDPQIVGKALAVNGESCSIVGVMPKGFRFAFAPDLMTNFTLDPAAAPRDFHVLFVAARLKQGVSAEQGRADLARIARNLADAYPKALKGWGVELWAWRLNFVAPESQRMEVLFGAVGFVLLIACANLANLLLTKAAARRREMAVRVALGAGRWRMMRQVLTESVLLSVVGSAGGVLLAHWLIPLAANLVWAPLRAAVAEMAIDGRVLAFALAVSVVTGLLFGALPAWRAARLDPNGELKAGSGAGDRSGNRFRSALVALEVALSVVLLAGAGLMIRSLTALTSSDMGFRAERVLTAKITMPEARYPDAPQVRAFDRAAVEAVKALPGVRSAAIGFAVPLEARGIPMRFQFASRPSAASENPMARFLWVSDEYFETLGIALRRGRLFTPRDDESAPRTAIVNEAFAKRFLGTADPLGERLVLDERFATGKEAAGAPLPWEIVGVVANAKMNAAQPEPTPQIYASALACGRAGGVLAVRTAGDPAALAGSVRSAIQKIDRDVPVTDFHTMEQVASEAFSEPRSQAWIVGAFAGVALILAALGIYGVMSYAVEQGTREMGLRMALGADPRALLAMVMRKGATLAAAGVVVGTIGAFALRRVVESMLFQVKSSDPASYIVAAVLLFGVALLATYIPARRAACLDPSRALRWE